LTNHSDTDRPGTMIEKIIESLTLEHKVAISNMEETELSIIEKTLGFYIGRMIGDADDLAGVLEQIWKRLKKTYKLRVVEWCGTGVWIYILAEATHPTETGGVMGNYQDRIIRALRLDAHLYEEVEADKGAMGQAMITVVLASLAAGIGAIGTVGIGGIVSGTLTALFAWFAWSLVTYVIGTKLMPEENTEADLGELLRTIGFSSSPGLIRVLGIIPGLAGIVFLVAGIWMLIAMVIAVRQALDYQSTPRAVAVCFIGWVVQVVIFGVAILIMGG
jgi:hypothetical protein